MPKIIKLSAILVLFLVTLAGIMPLAAQATTMPAVVNTMGSQAAVLEGQYKGGEFIRPVGWSRNGRFAYVAEHPVDGRGGTIFTYVIFDTVSDKVLVSIADDSETWSDRKSEDDAAESWRRQEKSFSRLLKEHGIEPGKGVVFLQLPVTSQGIAINAALELVKNPAHDPDADFAAYTGYTLTATTQAGKKKLATVRNDGFLHAWASGCFASPFEKRILVVCGIERFVFEGTEYYYNFHGCKLDSGFKP